jgi:hypothetical protein
MNWYKEAQNKEILKEAGTKENVAILMIGTLSAIATFFEGNMLMDYLNKQNVPVEHQQAFLNTVNTVNNTNKDLKELDKNDVVRANDSIKSEKIKEKSEESAEPEIEFSEKDYKSREEMTAQEVIARTLYDESRGEGYDGMKKVALVILNRSNGTSESMKDISLKPWQFSGWNNGRTLPSGSGKAWEQAKELTRYIMNDATKPDASGNHYFVNPEVVLKQKGINAPISNLEDIQKLPENILKKLPAFMFNKNKQDLGGGRWKWIYPKTQENLRTDTKVEGNHFFYSK